MSLDLTSFDAALKQHYTSENVENMVYMDNPLFALVAKYEEFGGRNLPIPLIYKSIALGIFCLTMLTAALEPGRPPTRRRCRSERAARARP